MWEGLARVSLKHQKAPGTLHGISPLALPRPATRGDTSLEGCAVGSDERGRLPLLPWNSPPTAAQSFRREEGSRWPHTRPERSLPPEVRDARFAAGPGDLREPFLREGLDQGLRALWRFLVPWAVLVTLPNSDVGDSDGVQM